MTTANAFDSARQPYTLELGERFNSPYDFYAWRNGQPFTFLAVVNPGDDPAVDDAADRCFASNSPMAKLFSRGLRRSTATSPSRAAGVHNPRPHRGVAYTPAAAPVVVGPPHRQTPPPH